jgi:hypothetical protein
MPHKHPEDRIYMVMSGVFYVGLGKTFDVDKMRPIRHHVDIVFPRPLIEETGGSGLVPKYRVTEKICIPDLSLGTTRTGTRCWDGARNLPRCRQESVSAISPTTG